jgi:hypothetical protein
MEAIAGGTTIVSVCAALVPPPGAGLLTVICPVPAFCRSVAVSATFTEVAFTYVVGREDPFHRTLEFAWNPVPVAVTVAAAPCATEFGAIALRTGIALVTAKSTALDVAAVGRRSRNVSQTLVSPEGIKSTEQVLEHL